MIAADTIAGASVFPTMVLLEEGASTLRCRMFSEPIHVLRRRAHRLGKLVCSVPGVLGVRETIDGVLIECDSLAASTASVRAAVRMFHALVSTTGANPTSGHSGD